MRRNTRIGYVPQQTAFPAGRTAAEIVAEAIAGERLDPLERAARINITLGRAGFTDGAALTESLSGGWLRRLAIARELALQPDLLFLDEPPTISIWKHPVARKSSRHGLLRQRGGEPRPLLLDNVVNDMAEIDRVVSRRHLPRRRQLQPLLETRKRFCWRNPAARNRSPTWSAAKWSGSAAPQARTGKSRARIDEAGRLIRELSDLESRSVKGVAQIDFTATEPPHQAPGLRRKDLQGAGRPHAVRDLSFTLTPGARLGLLGRNGVGKTTLLRLLAGELNPTPAASSAPPRCASFTSTRPASASTPLRPCARASARTAIP